MTTKSQAWEHDESRKDLEQIGEHEKDATKIQGQVRKEITLDPIYYDSNEFFQLGRNGKSSISRKVPEGKEMHVLVQVIIQDKDKD